MSLLNYLSRKNNKPSASLAKERLQIILAHERASINRPDYLPALKRDLMEVVGRYIKINADDIKINLEKEGDTEILELNIALPEPLTESTS
ncbi:MAG: cell division topological specificity factor MinE [Desulfobulbaceae bacterium]|nr:cell division topological specificity factor MinE [Desulfobulbaceae bacterium]